MEPLQNVVGITKTLRKRVSLRDVTERYRALQDIEEALWKHCGSIMGCSAL